MTPPDDSVDADALPQASVRRSRWRFSVVWVVPLIAAIVAGYLIYTRVRDVGPTITITFKDGFGVKPGQTEIRYRGVRLGDHSRYFPLSHADAEAVLQGLDGYDRDHRRRAGFAQRAAARCSLNDGARHA